MALINETYQFSFPVIISALLFFSSLVALISYSLVYPCFYCASSVPGWYTEKPSIFIQVDIIIIFSDSPEFMYFSEAVCAWYV